MFPHDRNSIGSFPEIFGYLLKSSDIFEKSSETIVWPSDNFWSVPGNLWKMFGNVRKIVSKSRHWYVYRELTNRRLSHDGAVSSPYSTAPSSCRNLNLRFAVKTATFMRDRQIFSPCLKFVFIFWEGELLKPNCLTSDKRELESHMLMEATL